MVVPVTFQPHWEDANNWRAKLSLAGEVDGKFCVAALAHIWLFVGVYIFLPYAHYWEVQK